MKYRARGFRPWLVALALAPALVGANAPAPPAEQRVLHVAVDPEGKIALEARGVGLDEVLDALAAKRGFAVVMARGVARPPVDVDVEDASTTEAVRRVMRGRNYALVYGATDGKLRRVVVFPPREPSRPASHAPTRTIARPSYRR
jgi:hypothetical protein